MIGRSEEEAADAAAESNTHERRCNPRAICNVTLVVLVSCKLWTYAGIRFLYPMSQFLANDWNLSSTQMSAVLAIGEFVPAGLFSSCGDIIGPRKLAVFSFLSLCLSSFGMLLPPSFSGLLVFRFCYGFGLFLFMVAAQTSATSQVPPMMRDCVTGILEMPYSMSALILVPILSAAYEAGGWRVPFIILATMIALHLPYLIYLAYCKSASAISVNDDAGIGAEATTEIKGSHTQGDEENEDQSAEPPSMTIFEEAQQQELPKQRVGLRAGIRWQTGAFAFNISGLCLCAAINLMATEFGFLLHSFFGLSEGDAGTAALVMGLAEFSGVMLATANLATGSIVMEVAGVLLLVFTMCYSYLGTVSLPISLTGLFFVFMLGEFGTVQRLSRAPLFASVEDASAMLGMHVQFQVVGRTIGAAIAAPLFFRADENLFLGHAVCCFVSSAFAAVMVLFLRLSVVQQKRYGVNHITALAVYTGV